MPHTVDDPDPCVSEAVPSERSIFTARIANAIGHRRHVGVRDSRLVHCPIQNKHIVRRRLDGEHNVCKMPRRALLSDVSMLALGFASASVHAEEKGTEKCYGGVKAGQYDCANLSGTQSCAGQSTTDMAAGDGKYVAKGTCKSLNGLSAEEAKAKAKK